LRPKAILLRWISGKSSARVSRVAAEGVIVRPVANYGMPNHLRITVGLPAENTRLLEALTKVLARG
jgi:histidinol-phosphate/aromatic aminotransferase/cobyric acid decarboxylase-like protein